MSVHSCRVGVLVADSSAFISAAQLERWSERVVTVREVVTEVRDVDTRTRLQALPYELSFREPGAEALQQGKASLLSRAANPRGLFRCSGRLRQEDRGLQQPVTHRSQAHRAHVASTSRAGSSERVEGSSSKDGEGTGGVWLKP